MISFAQPSNGRLRNMGASGYVGVGEATFIQGGQHRLDGDHEVILIRNRISNNTETHFTASHTLTYISRMELKNILQSLMDEVGISQNELADRTHVPQPTIHRILTGESRDPRQSTLKPIAAHFGITVAQLRGDEPIDGRPESEPEQRPAGNADVYIMATSPEDLAEQLAKKGNEKLVELLRMVTEKMNKKGA